MSVQTAGSSGFGRAKVPTNVDETAATSGNGESLHASVSAWLRARGIADDEMVFLGWKDDRGRFQGVTLQANHAGRVVRRRPVLQDCFVGANPVRRGLPAIRRGTARDVTRLACLWVDLDAAAAFLENLKTTQAVIDYLSDLLGVEPVSVTMTGHGHQPVWALEPEPGVTDWTGPDDEAFQVAKAFLRGWKLLVEKAAAEFGGQVDNVFNLDSPLRVPGTTNRKEKPYVTTTVDYPGQQRLTVARLREVLDAQGIQGPVPLTGGGTR